MSERFRSKFGSNSSISDFPSYIDSASVESAAIHMQDSPKSESPLELSEERPRLKADINFMTVGVFSALRHLPKHSK